VLQQKADLPPLLERCGPPLAPVWCRRTKADQGNARGGASQGNAGPPQVSL